MEIKGDYVILTKEEFAGLLAVIEQLKTTEIYARADAETKRKAIENAYEPLTPDAMPDWTSDPSLISWLDSLGR